MSAPSRRQAALVALAAVALSGLAACSSADAVDVGDVEAYTSGTPAGTEVSVVVPVGTLEVVVTEPAEEIGELRAPDGGSLVRVATRFRDGLGRADVWDLAGRAGAARAVELALGAGDRDYGLGVVRDGDGTDAGESVRAPEDLVVAVDGTPEELADGLTLEVGYDGLTQTVSVPGGERTAGPADALYEDTPDPSSLPTQDCEPRLRPAGATVAGLRCEVGAVRALPYVPDLGWAAEGTTWLVVGAGFELPGAEVDGATYAVASVDLAVEADGQAPDLVLDAAERGGRVSGQHVFAVPADSPSARISMRARGELRLQQGAGAPAARQLVATASTTVEVPDTAAQ